MSNVRYLTILFCLVSCGFTVKQALIMKQETLRLPQEKLHIVQNAGNACALEHNVGPGLLPGIGNGKLSRDEATNKYVHCFATKTGLIDEVGHIKIDTVAGLLGDHPRVDEFRESLRKCNEVTKENPVATAVEMNRCYGETAPVLFIFS